MKKHKKKLFWICLVILLSYVTIAPAGAIRMVIFFSGHPVIACTTSIKCVDKDIYKISIPVHYEDTGSTIDHYHVHHHWIFKYVTVTTDY